jgi:hypothetical protein
VDAKDGVGGLSWAKGSRWKTDRPVVSFYKTRLGVGVQKALPLLICQGSWMFDSSIILFAHAIHWLISTNSRIGHTSQWALQADKAVRLEKTLFNLILL